MQAELDLTALSALGEDDRAEVEALVARAGEQDGFDALNEAARLHLRHPRPDVTHLLARGPGGELAGYAQRDSGPVTATGHLVVAPTHRRSGVGTALLRELLTEGRGRLQLWAVGDTAAAAGLARAHGLVRVRELLVMARPLINLPEPVLPAGLRFRTFRPGQDEAAWLRLNASAFADHPEQGSLTVDDLAQRMSEPWFDPGGFLLAEGESGLVGFHWTKEHGQGLGEVYVLGVDPEAGGRGLGRALLLAGLRSLADRGNRLVELYVEADHARGVALYTGHGFAVASRDVMYAQPH